MHYKRKTTDAGSWLRHARPRVAASTVARRRASSFSATSSGMSGRGTANGPGWDSSCRTIADRDCRMDAPTSIMGTFHAAEDACGCSSCSAWPSCSNATLRSTAAGARPRPQPAGCDGRVPAAAAGRLGVVRILPLVRACGQKGVLRRSIRRALLLLAARSRGRPVPCRGRRQARHHGGGWYPQRDDVAGSPSSSGPASGFLTSSRGCGRGGGSSRRYRGR